MEVGSAAELMGKSKGRYRVRRGKKVRGKRQITSSRKKAERRRISNEEKILNGAGAKGSKEMGRHELRSGSRAC